MTMTTGRPGVSPRRLRESTVRSARWLPDRSRDGLSLYIASSRPGTLGGNDIWAADRSSKNEPFGAPTNLGVPVNSAANDFCPTPIHGSYLMFVSERPGEGTCNARPGFGTFTSFAVTPPSAGGRPHLGCVENGTGPNTEGAEFSPSLVSTDEGTFLYFSSNASGNQDIYRSRRHRDGSFGPPAPVHELNTEFDDRMPNVSTDGLEIVFSSDRTSTPTAPPGLEASMSTCRGEAAPGRSGRPPSISVPT